MIEFRCWYCNKKYVKRNDRIAERFKCTCEHVLRVPRRSGGRCRVKSPVDWLVEAVVYGGGGAVVGFVLALICISRFRIGYFSDSVMLIPGLTLAGFVVGLVGGERGLELIGRMFGGDERDR